MTKINYV